jgi:hypothetical protein
MLSALTPQRNGAISKRRRYKLPQIAIEFSNNFQITPKIFEDRDVDIVNECCGVCGSDVHTITGGWGDLSVCILFS